jgi:hypothetical protein
MSGHLVKDSNQDMPSPPTLCSGDSALRRWCGGSMSCQNKGNFNTASSFGRTYINRIAHKFHLKPNQASDNIFSFPTFT